MKQIFLLLTLAIFCSVNLLAQKTNKTAEKKEVVIIKDKDGKTVEKKIITSESEDSDVDVDSLLNSIFSELDMDISDFDDVDMEVTRDGKNGSEKVVITTMKDGKRSVTTHNSHSTTTYEVDLDDDLVDEDPMPTPKVTMGLLIGDNVIIDGVNEGGPASKAGLKSGDKLMKVDQQIIYSIHGLLEHLASYNPGDIVQVEVDRQGAPKTYKVELEQRK